MYRNRYVILAGGLKDPNVEHPYANRDGLPTASLPNFDVVVFDAEAETYRILPTPIPPYPVHPAQFAADPPEARMHDVRNGGYRRTPKLA